MSSNLVRLCTVLENWELEREAEVGQRRGVGCNDNAKECVSYDYDITMCREKKANGGKGNLRKKVENGEIGGTRRMRMQTSYSKRGEGTKENVIIHSSWNR